MMVRSSKVHGEKSNDTDYLEGKDWISNLPDAILCHILSLMPTKNAVRTGILSTRWKSLWASVPVIDLRYYRMGYGDPGSFMDFVDRVLLLHNSPNLTKFHLHCGWGNENPYRLNSWISTAINRHVQELVLSITSKAIFELPRHLFTSIDLVVLKLSYGFSWSALTVFLPRLKVLHLFSLNFLDDGSLKNLLSGCPVLEELAIITSPRGKINTLCICSSTLKKLIVLNFEERSVQCGVVIKAPSLESLELSDSVSRDFEVDELPALVKADVHVCFGNDGYEGSDYYCNAVVRMLAKASNVQNLWLYNATLKVVIHASAYNELLFPSLTHLHIAIHDIPWSVVPDLLGHIPSLTVLVLTKDRKCCDVCLWSGAPENVPLCLSLSLEKIEFNGFSGCNKEMKLVRYLLENAMVLKRLTLRSWSRNKKIKTDLQKYERGSSTCQIEFCHQKGRFGSYRFSTVEWL
ncbi:putative FBD-associated F-box protein At5g53635 [Rhododendron vialii]|uniref:putative FBD-associated F-box protein At5g53635 n=1 Tax=Rhododendron vialii TaxID=182163 RepID=UPI00265DC169|nr:putative FBD-associated F-box protein At5g53635 [Rhododendron vialii]XP_058210858.1 putative FBD-associated F-box protein At5g53635 [Rhododendron vialii]